MIGGFIVAGSQPKKVVLRAIGPSLNAANALADPTLQLFDANGASVSQNDNWRDSQAAEISASGFAPPSDPESAMIVTVNPGNYTAVLQGTKNTTGLALFEVYDLAQAVASQLVNISTRSFVGTGDNVTIGGFVVNSRNGQNGSIVIRAIGPSLADAGISDSLQDPQLQLFVGNSFIQGNDNWQDDRTQASLLTSVGLQPQNANESAMVVSLPTGQYTAIVNGASGTIGTALIEVYNVTPIP